MIDAFLMMFGMGSTRLPRRTLDHIEDQIKDADQAADSVTDRLNKMADDRGVAKRQHD